MTKDVTTISTVTTFLNGVSNCRGQTSPILKKMLTDENCLLIRFSFEKLNTSEATSDILQMILEFILPITSFNKEDESLKPVIAALSEYKQSIINLVRSNSILKCYYGVQLYTSLVSRNLSLPDKELIWEIIDILFKYPYSSTLHCLVSQTIISMFDNKKQDILFENHEKFLDRIISAIDKREENKKADFYPHLTDIIKKIGNDDYSNNILKENENWINFKNKHWESINSLPGDNTIYCPTEETMRAKEKQLQGVRAGRFTPS